MYKNTTPERVRQVREFHKLSQGELAVRLGVSRRTVIRFEQRGAYLATWRGAADGNTWAELAAAYDAACDNFGSPAEAPIGGEVLQKLSHRKRVTKTGRPKRGTRRRAAARARKTVTGARRRRISRKVAPRRRSDKSRSRRVTGRRRKGRRG